MRRSGTQKFMHQNWPRSILSFVKFIFPHYEIWVRGRGEGVQERDYPLLLRLSVVLIHPWARIHEADTCHARCRQVSRPDLAGSGHACHPCTHAKSQQKHPFLLGKHKAHTHTHMHTHVGNRKNKRSKLLRSCRAALDVFLSVEAQRSAKE